MPLRKGTAVVLRSRGRGGKERDTAFKEPKHGQNIKTICRIVSYFCAKFIRKVIWCWTLLPDLGQVCLRDLPKEDMVYLRDSQKEVHVCLRDPQKESHVSDPQKKAMSSSETRHWREFSISKNLVRMSNENSRSVTRNPFLFLIPFSKFKIW